MEEIVIEREELSISGTSRDSIMFISPVSSQKRTPLSESQREKTRKLVF